MTERDRKPLPEAQGEKPERKVGTDAREPVLRKDGDRREPAGEEKAERPRSYLILDPPPPKGR